MHYHYLAQNYSEKRPNVGIAKDKTQTKSDNAGRLQSDRQIEAGVPEMYWTFALICSIPKPIWRQLNISTFLRQEKSLCENTVFLYSSQQVVLHIRASKKTNTDKIYK